MEEMKELTDTLLVSYLALLGFQIRPQKNGTLISFEVKGEELNKAIEDFYYANPSVRVLDFCKTYRTLRSALFNLRGQR